MSLQIPPAKTFSTRHGPLSVTSIVPDAPTTENAPTLVFLPPSLFPVKEAYRPLINHFAATHRIILIDPPGHGECPAWDDPIISCSFKNLAESVMEILESEELGIKGELIYIGTSWGASIGFELLVAARKETAKDGESSSRKFKFKHFLLFSSDPYLPSTPMSLFLLFMSNVIYYADSFPLPERLKLVDAGFSSEWAEANPELIKVLHQHARKVPAGVMAGTTRAMAWNRSDTPMELKKLGKVAPAATLVLAHDDPICIPMEVQPHLEREQVPLDFKAVEGRHVWNLERWEEARDIIASVL